MANLLNNLRSLFIPNKNKGPGYYRADMQAIENWAKQVIVKLDAGTNISLAPSNGVGPEVTINSTGGSGITAIHTLKNSIQITFPTGPTTDLDIAGLPYLNSSNFSDSVSNSAYGQNAGLSLTGSSGNDTAIGFAALQAATSANGCTAVGVNALVQCTTTTNNTAVGYNCLDSTQTSPGNTAVGVSALSALVVSATGNNTAVGYSALSNLQSGSQCTAVGYNTQCGTTPINATAIGAGVTASANGAVAIGIDNGGTSAVSNTTNIFVLGTALHQIKISNNTTGAGSAALGTNSPATTNTAPYTWFKMQAGDGSTVYVPAWK